MTLTRRSVLQTALHASALVAASACVQTPSRTKTTRAITQLVRGTPHRDGAGVSLTKLLGGRALPMLDPFLMLDGFHSREPRDFIAGFPDHPHRGFETVTIMLDGVIEHRDSVGNHGRIEGGGLQWMTAGRGIVHAEMPNVLEPGGDMWGFQLWINLPAREKWKAPRYQDTAGHLVPKLALDDGEARVLAGSIGKTRGPIGGVTVDPLVLDVRIPGGGRVRHDVPASHAAFLAVASGTVTVGGRDIPTDAIAVLGPGTTVELQSTGAQARALLFAGAPIGEPVARRGPFVMNTDDEIRQAFEDYRSGRLAGG
jgi:quercetin 2,3-dioxygenase